MSQDKAFWDRIARKYAQDPIADRASYEHKLEKTLRELMRKGFPEMGGHCRPWPTMAGHGQPGV